VIHIVYDVTNCAAPPPEPTDLLAAMRDTATRLGCTVLGELPITFQPHGTTCVLVLAESHLTVSTWPEHNLAHIDLFTCRADTDPDHAVTPILGILGSTTVHTQHVPRLGPTHLNGTNQRTAAH
jgi:S-adenosylmethionine decarboxylase